MPHHRRRIKGWKKSPRLRQRRYDGVSGDLTASYWRRDGADGMRDIWDSTGSVVIHGYTANDLDHCARLGVKMARTATPEEDYELALSTVYLAVAETEPDDRIPYPFSRRQLADIAWSAIMRERQAWARHHGNGDTLDPETGLRQKRQRFVEYWSGETLTGMQSFTTARKRMPWCMEGQVEVAVVWPLAVQQILTLLTERQREIATVVAATGDRQATADALGLARKTVDGHMSIIRRVFWREWVGEEPPEYRGTETHCRYGHELVIVSGKPKCRKCWNDAQRRYRRKRSTRDVAA